jgi:hypothetical protein
LPCPACVPDRKLAFPAAASKCGAVGDCPRPRWTPCFRRHGACCQPRYQQALHTKSDAEGIFRLVDLPAGEYEVSVQVEGVESTPARLALSAGQIQSRDIGVETSLRPTPLNGPSGLPGAARSLPVADVSSGSVYPGMRSPQSESLAALPEVVPTLAENFSLEPYRWTVEMPAWQRYKTPGDYPYVQSHWYDPFNRNRWKADYPIFGQQWFLKFTGTSLTDFDLRRLPTPSGLGSQDPNSEQFLAMTSRHLWARPFSFHSIFFMETLHSVRLISRSVLRPRSI